MHLKARHQPAGGIHYDRIGHDNGGDPRFIEIAQVFFNPGDIFIVGVNIRGDKNLGAVFFGKFHALAHFLEAEIIRSRAQAVFLSSNIYCIRTIMHGEFQFLQITRRSKELRFVQTVTFALVLRLGHGSHSCSPLHWLSS
ncbi:hypothetical protein D3C86_1822090 [compost metagenome]